MDELGSAPIITPSTCSTHGYQVTLWCNHCRVGRPVGDWSGPGWRAEWDTPLATLFQAGRLRCRRPECKRLIASLVVEQESRRGGQFVKLLELHARGIRVEGVLRAGGVMVPFHRAEG